LRLIGEDADVLQVVIETKIERWHRTSIRQTHPVVSRFTIDSFTISSDLEEQEKGRENQEEKEKKRRRKRRNSSKSRACNSMSRHVTTRPAAKYRLADYLLDAGDKTV